MAASKLSNEEKLKRFIYINNIDAKYVSGGPDNYASFTKEKKELLADYAKNYPEQLFEIIVEVNEDKNIPHRAVIYYLLASILKSEGVTEQVKAEVSRTALTICKTDEEFFCFVRYVTTLKVNRKLPPTVAKAIRKFYKKKIPQHLADSYAKYTSYHSWSHKDLIKLGHVKSETPLKNAIINYILFKKPNDKDDDIEGKSILEMLKKSDTLRKTKDHAVAIPIIAELKATISQVEPSLRKSAEVWNAVLPNMSLMEILKALPKLYKLGFLKKDSSGQALVNKTLTDVEKIKASGIHPIEVFIYMKNFEKGGKPLDPKLLLHLVTEKKVSDEELKRFKTPHEARTPVVLSNLQKCMNISCTNIQPTGKRYMVTIDVTTKMDTSCLHHKNITALEAATAFAMTLMRVEKDVTVAVFKQKEISIVQLDKKGQLHEHVQKLRENKNDYLIPSAPIEWALTQRKHIDIFFNFIHHEEYYLTIPKDVAEKTPRPVDVLQRYKKKYNLLNAKLVTFCLASPHLSFSDGSPNTLDIAGLDVGVPRAVDAFCRGNFA